MFGRVSLHLCLHLHHDHTLHHTSTPPCGRARVRLHKDDFSEAMTWCVLPARQSSTTCRCMWTHAHLIHFVCLAGSQSFPVVQHHWKLNDFLRPKSGFVVAGGLKVQETLHTPTHMPSQRHPLVCTHMHPSSKRMQCAHTHSHTVPQTKHAHRQTQ